MAESCQLQRSRSPAVRDGHRLFCYCGKLARYHVRYGSGCGNVCGWCLRRMRRTGRQVLATKVLVL